MTPRSLVEQLWETIPAHLRVRDEEALGFLRGLVEVLAEHAELVASDIDTLGDDWFIETCAEWVVPYIADLVGERILHTFEDAGMSNRARIADTLRYRRRKGTAAMLEDLARATTGWPAKAVEYFEVMATTQHLNHVRHHAQVTAPIRDANLMELVGTPFDVTSHTADVRPMQRIAAGSVPTARYNLPNIGLSVWPVPSYPLDRATAVAAATPPDGRWFVEPLGGDRPMAGPSVVETSIEHRAEEANVPISLRRRPLHDELAALRSAPAGSPIEYRWFAPDDPAFVVWIQPSAGGPLAAVPLRDLFIADLSDWSLPTGSQVWVDPVLGRVAVAAGRAVHRLAVSWAYAFSGDVGAGPYPRFADRLAELMGDDPDQPIEPQFQIGVSVTDEPVPATVVATIAEAIDAWHSFQSANPSSIGRIVLMDSHRYPEAFTGPNRIAVDQGCRLVIVAGRWPAPADGPRKVVDVDFNDVRPCLAGDVEVVGTGAGDRPGELWLDGLLVDGGLRVVGPVAGGAGLGVLGLTHSSLVPSRGGLAIDAGNDRIGLTVARSITGPLTIAGDRIELRIEDSIIDAAPLSPATSGAAIDAPGGDAVIRAATILGTTSLRSLRADDSIFDDVASVARNQQGCVRFCYLTPGSTTPRRYRCQPDRAIEAAPGDPTVAARLEPAYVSREATHYGYARLAEHAATELLTGAESDAEMGAFGHVMSRQRLANLLDLLVEYVPFGRDAAPLPALAPLPDR